jgi:hypothetical protein
VQGFDVPLFIRQCCFQPGANLDSEIGMQLQFGASRNLSSGWSPSVEMTLREMQAAHNAGEVARILKRGYGI